MSLIYLLEIYNWIVLVEYYTIRVLLVQKMLDVSTGRVIGLEVLTSERFFMS